MLSIANWKGLQKLTLAGLYETRNFLWSTILNNLLKEKLNCFHFNDGENDTFWVHRWFRWGVVLFWPRLYVEWGPVVLCKLLTSQFSFHLTFLPPHRYGNTILLWLIYLKTWILNPPPSCLTPFTSCTRMFSSVKFYNTSLTQEVLHFNCTQKFNPVETVREQSPPNHHSISSAGPGYSKAG